MSLFRNDVSAVRRGFSAGRMAATLGALALSLALIPAMAEKTKAPKKKKNVDLSANPLGNVASRQPDKELYDKAMVALKKGRYDVARLDLQTLLNTYQESEYQMRAKLAVGDSWFKEGGTAALTQAEAEYKDFITFFPQAPEAAEAQMKVADIYYMQMEKPDRDFNNAVRAEQEYRAMINSFPDSTLVPRAKQKLREVQEVLGEREFLIGQYYAGRENWSGAIARLQTVADTYPLYSHSDQLWLTIGDAYAGEARTIRAAASLPGAVRERLQQVYQDKAAVAYSNVIMKYPMAPHVEDARDRLIAMNRPVPEPTDAAVAEDDAIERSRQGVRFTDKAIGIVKHGPVVVEAAHIGDPTMLPPKRVTAPDVNKMNNQVFAAAYKAVQPGAATTEAAAPTPTSNTEPPRSDRPQSSAPLQFDNVPTGDGSGNNVSATIISAPNSAPAPAADPNAPVQPVKTTETTLPAPEAAAAAPAQVNDVKPGSTPAAATAVDPNAKPTKKKPKLDESDESSSKKKKKKGLAKLNPF
jgi:outer membrane protein assembly factor BamD